MIGKQNADRASRQSPQKQHGKELSDEAVERIQQNILEGVGYKRPPVHSRFQKGQSGNPGGRPRGVARDLSMHEQPTLEAMLRASRKKVKMREGDKISEVTSMEAVLQSVIAAALKGNARSQGLAIDLARTSEHANARDIEKQNAVWTLIKDDSQLLLDAAIACGESTREILPHPDDIIIDQVNRPRIIGPVCIEEQIKCEETIAVCETLLMQDALDQRSAVRHNGEPLTAPGSAFLLFLLLQRSLPPRLQMSDAVICVRMGRYCAWPKRELLKALHQSWNKLGGTMPRGTVSPNLGDVRCPGSAPLRQIRLNG